MKITAKIGIFMLALALISVPAVACGEATIPSTKITLADAPIVLDMSSDLPANFERLDAASEGMSNEDMGLGPDFSGVELFLCEEPFQVIIAYFCIAESQVERAAGDAILKDEQQVKALVLEGMQLGAAEEDIELGDVDMHITYPDVGDLAVLGSGTMSTYGANIGYDYLIFKSNKVYVFMGSFYLSEESVSLIPLAEGIEQRIGAFSQ